MQQKLMVLILRNNDYIRKFNYALITCRNESKSADSKKERATTKQTVITTMSTVPNISHPGSGDRGRRQSVQPATLLCWNPSVDLSPSCPPAAAPQ